MPYWSRGVQPSQSQWALPTWALNAGQSLEALTASIPSSSKSLQLKDKVEDRRLSRRNVPTWSALLWALTESIFMGIWWLGISTWPFCLRARLGAPRGLVPASPSALRAGGRGTFCIKLEGPRTRRSLSHFAVDEERKMWCFPATEAADPRSVECCSSDNPNRLKDSGNHQAARATESLFRSCKHGLRQHVPLSYLSQNRQMMMVISSHF